MGTKEAIKAMERRKARRKREQDIYDLAVEQWSDDGADIVGPISEGDDNGAYIQAWLWVDFTGTELDKDEN